MAKAFNVGLPRYVVIDTLIGNQSASSLRCSGKSTVVHFHVLNQSHRRGLLVRWTLVHPAMDPDSLISASLSHLNGTFVGSHDRQSANEGMGVSPGIWPARRRAGHSVDWVHAAFAIHHFRDPDHVRFLEGARRRISDPGLLRWFDVFPEANESRDESSDRSVAQVRQSFGLSVEQRDAVVIHMRKCH